MVTSLRDDLRAAGLVRSRIFISRLEFWLLLVGYDRDTHAFSSRIYLLYLIIFFSLWGLAVLVLLAGFAGQILIELPFASPFEAALVVGVAAIIAILLLELHFASRRSPFIFSKADAYLLCLTPLDRRIVGVLWCLEAWLVRGLFIWPGFIVLAYALQESQAMGEFAIADLPGYMLKGLRILLVAVPLHLTAQSLAWSVGAWRLQGKRDLPPLRWASPVLILAVIIGWILAAPGSAVPVPFWLQPLAYPLAAGLSAASLPAGLGLSLVWATLGLFCLWLASQKLSLARAAQETHGSEVKRAAVLIGAGNLAEEMRQRERLGAGRRPSRLPIRPGLSALLWRNTIQGQRSLTLGRLFSWLGVLSLTIGMLLVSDWGVRAWSFVFWCLIGGQMVVRDLRGDLKRWWLLRQLPYPSMQLVAIDLIFPLITIALSGVVGLIIAWVISLPIQPLLVWLFFPSILVLGSASGLDILYRCKSEHLLSGRVPDLSLLAVILTATLILIPGAIAWLAVNRWSFPLWLAAPAALAVITSEAYGLYRLAVSRFRNIR